MDATKALAEISRVIHCATHDERQLGTKLYVIRNIVKRCNLPSQGPCKQHGVDYCKLCHNG